MNISKLINITQLNLNLSLYKNNNDLLTINNYSWESMTNEAAKELAVNISKLVNLTKLDLDLLEYFKL